MWMWNFLARVFVSWILIYLPVCGSIVGSSRGDDFSHEVDLMDFYGIRIQWRHFQTRNNTNGDKHPEKWIEMKVTGQTTGYVGIGFSPSGGMSGADMAIGWVDQNGQSHLKDFHGEWNGMPIEDLSQDYVLLNASEAEDGTMIQFKRKWNTCDHFNDLPIGNHATQIIWALGDEDPVENRKGRLHMSWHGAMNRGTQKAFMVRDVAFSSARFKADQNSKSIYSKLNQKTQEFKIQNDIGSYSPTKHQTDFCQSKQRVSPVKAIQNSQDRFTNFPLLPVLCSILQTLILNEVLQ